jgi:predicted transcriptional regulator
MTIAIPAEIERALGEKAAKRRMTVEELVSDALRWYLQIESGLTDELAAWQEVRDEALKTIEGASS